MIRMRARTKIRLACKTMGQPITQCEILLRNCPMADCYYEQWAAPMHSAFNSSACIIVQVNEKYFDLEEGWYKKERQGWMDAITFEPPIYNELDIRAGGYKIPQLHLHGHLAHHNDITDMI